MIQVSHLNKKFTLKDGVVDAFHADQKSDGRRDAYAVGL